MGDEIELHGMTVVLGEYKPLRKLSFLAHFSRFSEPFISDIVPTGNQLVVVSFGGEVFTVSLFQRFKCGKTGFREELDIERVRQIASVYQRNQDMCLF